MIVQQLKVRFNAIDIPCRTFNNFIGTYHLNNSICLPISSNIAAKVAVYLVEPYASNHQHISTVIITHQYKLPRIYEGNTDT
jgi:hypothetical protein